MKPEMTDRFMRYFTVQLEKGTGISCKDIHGYLIAHVKMM